MIKKYFELQSKVNILVKPNLFEIKIFTEDAF